MSKNKDNEKNIDQFTNEIENNNLEENETNGISGENNQENIENIEGKDQGEKNKNIQNESKKDKKNLGGFVKKSFSSKAFKNGAYSTAISVAVIVIVFIINLFVTKLDINIDLSSEEMYTLTEDTLQLINNLEDDVTIYYLGEVGNEMELYKNIIDNYGKASNKIKVETKDPNLYPKFAAQYVDDTITSDSVIVVNNSTQKAKYVDYSDMFETSYDYTTYEQYVSAIDVEGQITSAIQYVTNEDLPVMYIVSGHGEMSLGETITNSLSKQNVTTNTLETLTVESIPEDCSILLINAPQDDYTEDEVTMIKEYLANGGNAIITLDYYAQGLTNFNSLLNYYGVEIVDGIIVEGNSNNFMGQYPTYIIPEVESHSITSDVADMNIVAPNAVGLKVLDTIRSSVNIEPLLTTTDMSYSKVDVNSTTVSQEDEDIEGPFTIGLSITETYNDVETNIVVYSSANMLQETFVAYSSLGNLELLNDTIGHMAGEQSSLSIRTRSYTTEYLVTTSAQANLWFSVVVFIIPISIIVVGIYACLRRRRR